MNIREACEAILGAECAASIIADMGIHWCVFAAMSAATTDDDPRAIQAIRAWNAELEAGRREGRA